MGISRDKEIYTAKWLNGLKNIPALTYTATVDFWDRSSERPVYNSATNTYTVTYTPINSAPIACRIQNIRSAVQRFTATDPTWSGHVLISVHIDDRPSLEVGTRVKVKSTQNNEDWLHRFMTVKEILDPDYAIESTFLCEMDTELNDSA